jgi:Ax21 family sulfation-dependent quorum factor
MKRTLLALTLLAALPFAASAADGVSYTYVEGGYTATNTDGGDADGWALKGSGAIAPNFHLFGEYDQQEIENTNFDVDHYRVGVGYNRDITANTDLLTRVAYENYDFGQGLDFDGYSVEAGVRSALAPNFEGYALAGYEDGDAYDGEFYGRVGGQVKFNQTWGVSGDVKFIDGDTQYFVGPRVSF